MTKRIVFSVFENGLLLKMVTFIFEFLNISLNQVILYFILHAAGCSHWPQQKLNATSTQRLRKLFDIQQLFAWRTYSILGENSKFTQPLITENIEMNGTHEFSKLTSFACLRPRSQADSTTGGGISSFRGGGGCWYMTGGPIYVKMKKWQCITIIFKHEFIKATLK